MITFDASRRNQCTVRRQQTSTPMQALVLLNDPQFIEAARGLAERAMRHSDKYDQRVAFISQHILARNLSAVERTVVRASHSELAEFYDAHADDAQKLAAVGETEADENVDVAQLATWTMLCNQLMNLDEALNK